MHISICNTRNEYRMPIERLLLLQFININRYSYFVIIILQKTMLIAYDIVVIIVLCFVLWLTWDWNRNIFNIVIPFMVIFIVFGIAVIIARCVLKRNILKCCWCCIKKFIRIMLMTSVRYWNVSVRVFSFFFQLYFQTYYFVSMQLMRKQ